MRTVSPFKQCIRVGKACGLISSRVAQSQLCSFLPSIKLPRKQSYVDSEVTVSTFFPTFELEYLRGEEKEKERG